MGFVRNPFFWAGLVIGGNFLINYLTHLIFENHPFFSDISTHFYHVYIALIGAVLLLIYLVVYRRSR